MNRRYYPGVTLLALLALLTMPWAAPIAAQEHGGGGGGGGCGDVFGDLVHLLRDADTGQPILARRYVELPAEVPGYGWGYCPIAITAEGEEIPFLPYSCDLDLDPDRDGVEELEAVEVDYFGRLSGGRTKEKNHRMHFNEVISTIKMAGAVKAEPATGRLMMGFDCEPKGNFFQCAEWSVVDSPMESMALYTRLAKYGHFQTDPQELDVWVHGDPAGVPPFNPALDPADWAKFHKSLWHLLPFDADVDSCFDLGGNGAYDPPEPYVDLNENGQYEMGEPFSDLDENGLRDPGDWFNPDCATPKSLDDRDFSRAATFLGAAANKTGIVTVDLVQYMNRILKIPLNTHTTSATPDTLPALVRDCEDTYAVYEPPDELDPSPVDLPYLDPVECSIYDADDSLENWEIFPDLQERFVDFGALEEEPYLRSDWRDEEYMQLIVPDPSQGSEPTAWYLEEDVDVSYWLELANGPEESRWNIDGFVAAASDAVRTIEFVHNYAVPVYFPWTE